MSAITAHAPAPRQFGAEIQRGMRCRRQSRSASCPPRSRRGRRPANPRPRCSHAARSRLASRHAGTGRDAACRRQPRSPKTRYGSKKRDSPVTSRLSRTRSIGEDDATHFGPRSQDRACATCGDCPQLGAQPPQRRRAPPSRRSVRGSFCPAACLDLGEHVGGPPAGEVAGDHVRRHADADALEFLRGHAGRDRLAVHQHAIAVEDDHRVP